MFLMLASKKKKNGADAGFPRSTSVCLVSRKPPFSYPLPVLPLSLEDLIGGTRNWGVTIKIDDQ